MQAFDVLVVGGGSAGLAAAVASARAGAQTLLVERLGSIGGMAPAALVHSICGLYRLPSNGWPPVLANPGFASEFARRLIESGGASGPVRMGRVDVLLQNPTAFACLADVLIRETPRLKLLLHTEVSRLSAAGEATLSCRGQSIDVRAQTVVDASGDGVVAALIGAPFEQSPSDRLQRPAFIFGMAGVDTNDFGDDVRLGLAGLISSGVKDGQLSAAALGVAFRATGHSGEVFATLDLAGSSDFDPTNPETLATLEQDGRQTASEIVCFLRNNSPKFLRAFASAFPNQVGIRESRRVAGQYRLQADDLQLGREFADAVALATWPIELRETNRGPRLRYPIDGRPCEIPLRSLRFRDHPEFFVAGRCLSCSHEAQASIRVIGTCLATGEAAGFAAASLALHGEATADRIRKLRQEFAS